MAEAAEKFQHGQVQKPHFGRGLDIVTRHGRPAAEKQKRAKSQGEAFGPANGLRILAMETSVSGEVLIRRPAAK